MQSLPSYVKDTTDFITKQFQVTSQKTYLVTLDVSSLYTNISHKDGIEACRYFLENNGHSSGSLSVDNFCSLIELVLKNNYFKFNNICYRQRMGTAMGSSLAPAYASLLMGKFEMDFMKICLEKPTHWLRFLANIFMVWTHSLDKLYEFIKCFNNFHPYIKFMYDISETKVSFLDVDILLQNNYISTSVHTKSTNIHQYVEYSSYHPRAHKNGIPYSQAKRYRRIMSDNSDFSNALTDLSEFFIARNYPAAVINYAFNEVCKLSQSEALVPSSKDNSSNIIPFVIKYNLSLPNIGYIINRYWDLLQLSSNSSVKKLHNYKPVMAHKRPRKIKDILVKSKFSEPSDFKFFSSKCKRPRCTHCSRIVESDHFLSSQKCTSFKLNYDTNCTTRNVIYLISCKNVTSSTLGKLANKCRKE